MLTRPLIIAAVAFSVGFGIGTYWQSLLRSLDTAYREAFDAKQISASHIAGAELATDINTIESNALKEITHAATETDDIGRGLATGTIRLQLNAALSTACEAISSASVANGTRAGHDTLSRQDRIADHGAKQPTLARAAEPDYLALRASLKRCPAKVAALQAILKEERRLGSK